MEKEKRCYIIEEESLNNLIDGYLKYKALKEHGVENWIFYYDALFELFGKPKENYEDVSEIREKFKAEHLKEIK